MARLKSVRRDAERSGRDDRAPRTNPERRSHRKYIGHKDVAGVGADHHTRGRVRSRANYFDTLGERFGDFFSRCGAQRQRRFSLSGLCSLRALLFKMPGLSLPSDSISWEKVTARQSLVPTFGLRDGRFGVRRLAAALLPQIAGDWKAGASSRTPN